MDHPSIHQAGDHPRRDLGRHCQGEPGGTSALPDYVRCRILVGGVQRDAAATLVGNAAPGPTGEMGPSVAEIVLQTAITTTASNVAFVQRGSVCSMLVDRVLRS